MKISVDVDSDGIATVHDREDMLKLWEMGCFGKSSVNRTQPSPSSTVGQEEFVVLSSFELVFLSDALKVTGVSFTDDYAGPGIWTRYCLDALKETPTKTHAANLHQFIQFISTPYNSPTSSINFTRHWQTDKEFMSKIIMNKFIARYITYYNYRQQGYIVYSGIKYGVDFLLYCKAIQHCHAKFCVDVHTSSDERNWRWILAKMRLVSSVNKKLKIALVQLLPDGADIDLKVIWKIYNSSHDACSIFGIAEKDLGRWVPQQSRAS